MLVCDFGLAYLLVMLGGITDQPWNVSVVTPQRFISHSEMTLWPRSQEHSRRERKVRGRWDYLRGFQEKHKNSEIFSSFCGSDPDVWSKGNSPLLCAHPTGSLYSKKRDPESAWDALYFLAGVKFRRVKSALESDRPGFKSCLYRLLHLWPWTSC